MKISLNGFKEQVATFEADSDVTAGAPVKISANGTVKACAAGDAVCGYAIAVRDGFASVQLGGYISAPFTGSLTLGFCAIVADSDGKIKAGSTGEKVLITDIDTTNAKVGFIL